jgi:hypothetical protein
MNLSSNSTQFQPISGKNKRGRPHKIQNSNGRGRPKLSREW